MATTQHDTRAPAARYTWLTAGVLLRAAGDCALGAVHWLRFLIMRATIRRRVRTALAGFRPRGTFLCLAAAALLCAACGTERHTRHLAWTIEEFAGPCTSFDAAVDTAGEILVSHVGIDGPLSVFDETILYYRDAPAVLDTTEEIIRSSDAGLMWTIDEILRS
ncbi:MAG TPA: hypothetical protein DCM87_17425 [Planctomycetes bacterium]|nr:hypothetical protein [Planctomycetota bacterium]